MPDSKSDPKDSVTEVAGKSFVRTRPPDIERGSVLASRYQVEDIIGKGGSGIVLRVFDRTVQSVVALKVLKTELALDAKWDKRFSRELRLGRPIQHPNVCRIFDIGEADGYRFLTMELAAGGSLRDELKRTPATERPIEQRMADVKMAVAGLAALHAGGVVHRDFKPDNLLRMADGRLVISDFGLATDAANAPGATVLIGTPHYMAPEVLGGEPATSRSDVWALGVVLHEIIFGQRPERRSVSFDGATRGPLRPTSTAERFMLALCERCLAEVPLDRPSDASVVAKMLASARAGRRAGGSRRLARAALFAGVTVALASILGVAIRHRPQAASSVGVSAGTVRLSPVGTPSDWTDRSRVIASVPGDVQCFSVLNGNTARLIWGRPRRAEDVDMTSGQRRPAHLDPQTYRVGCPDLAADGHSLLFTSQSDSGATEIRLSAFEDGHDARTVTSGADPQWLGRSEDFSYEADAAHVAIFSLPTVTLALLPDAEFGQHRMILQKAVNAVGNAVALVLGNEKSEYAIAVYQGPSFGPPKVFAVPMKYRIQFGTDNEELLASYRFQGLTSALAALDWRAEKLRNLGFYRGYDLTWAHWPEEQVLVARRKTSDVWLYESGRRRRLTSDGRSYSAARWRDGTLLLSKLGDDGSVDIWSQRGDGVAKQMTHGGRDVEPAFAPDGSLWSYADYARKSIMICPRETDQCRVLRQDEMLPSHPSFSPDGRSLAYVTTLGVSKVVVISLDDGHVEASWSAYYECPPVWTSATTIWSLEAASGKYSWAERDITSGSRTGNRESLPNGNVALGGEIQCWPSAAPSSSPFFESVRVEADEVSRLLALRPVQP